jgi:uncharacterized membrane protein
MRATELGRVLFAAGFVGLGILSLASGDFALNWQPVPAWVPWRAPFAYASGAMLLAGGLGMFFKRTTAASALLLTVNMLIWLLLLRLPRVLASPAAVSMWLGFGETMTLVIAGLLLVGASPPSDKLSAKLSAGAGGVRVARLLFAAALIPIGLSHLVYVKATTDLVPAWLPNRVAFTYITGTAHLAAGVGLLLAILPRLAVTLEAIMLGLFTILVWGPRVVAAPTTRFPATAMLISAAITGAAFVVAGSLRDVPWARNPVIPSASEGSAVVSPRSRAADPSLRS